ncbi:MAG: hypothetical protein HGA72_07035 [Chlorobiaceae bacterium]|nr:hypothetical protein [Chlorobiaceae bacterium]
MDYRYQLERGGSKHICPACQQRRFVRYVDTLTGEEVAEDVGRCDREDSCSYHLSPSEYVRNGGKMPEGAPILPIQRTPAIEPEPSFFDAEMAEQSLKGYEQNNFCRWLISIFGEEKAFRLADAYHIGTSKHWQGAVIFWQQDVTCRIRSGKIMLYDAEKGKRVKEPFPHTTWVHKVLKIEPYHLRQCLFGEHLLLVEERKPVAVVESEKTAIVSAGFVPEFVWLATGGKGLLKRERLQVLRDRDVTLFPDLGAFEKWRGIVKDLPGVRVSDILEKRATKEDRTAGLDLADYLLRENSVLQTCNA